MPISGELSPPEEQPLQFLVKVTIKFSSPYKQNLSQKGSKYNNLGDMSNKAAESAEDSDDFPLF